MLVYTKAARNKRVTLERHKKVINICEVENETRTGERAQYTEINEDEWKKKKEKKNSNNSSFDVVVFVVVLVQKRLTQRTFNFVKYTIVMFVRHSNWINCSRSFCALHAERERKMWLFDLRGTSANERWNVTYRMEYEWGEKKSAACTATMALVTAAVRAKC